MKKTTKIMSLISILAITLLGGCGTNPDANSSAAPAASSNTPAQTSSVNGNTSAAVDDEASYYVVYDGNEYEESPKDAFEVYVGEGTKNLAAYLYEDGEAAFAYTSSDDATVSVGEASGKLTFLKEGSATITVKNTKNTKDPEFTFSFTVKTPTNSSGSQSFSTASYEEKGKILSVLEKYAVDNYLTGITMFSNGSNVLYNSRYTPTPKEYITGYGWGTTREGKYDGELTNAYSKHGDYYNIGTTSLPAHANALNASGSDVSTVYGYISNTFFSTRLNETNDGYEWYPSLALEKVNGQTQNKPFPLDGDGNIITDSNNASYDYNKHWRIYVRDDVKYKTNSDKTVNGVNIKETYNNKTISLNDYITPIKFLLTAWNAQYRGAESTSGVSALANSAAYYAATSKNTTGDSSALWDENLWHSTGMDQSVKLGSDSNGNYIDFTLLYPCTQFYAMYYLSSSYYSPLPESFIKLWGPKKLGKLPDGYSPVDTMLSTGPFYIEEWNDGKSILFKANDQYFWKKDTFADGNTRDVYNPDKGSFGGIAYNKISESSVVKSEFLKGSIDSYSPSKDDLAGDMKGETFTNDNMTWKKYKTKGDANFKLNVNGCTSAEWKEKFGKSGTVYQHDSDTYTTSTWSGVKPFMSNIHFRNFLSYALDRKTICESRGMTPTQEYLSDNYLIDPETGVSYNSTEAHKAVLADRYNDTYGYNVDAAKKELKLAFEDTAANGGIVANRSKLKAGSGANPGTSSNPYKVTLTMEWMNTTDVKDYADVFDSIKQVFSEFADKYYDGGYVLDIQETLGSSDYNAVYDKMKRGEFDLGFGAISGNDLNPLNFFEVLKSDNSSGFTLNWGPDTSKVDSSIVYDGKTWSFDSLWKAGDSGVILTNDGSIANIENVSSAKKAGSYYYESSDATAQTATYKLSFDLLVQGGVTIKDIQIASSSLTKTYVTDATLKTEQNELVTLDASNTASFVITSDFNTVTSEDSDAETDNNTVTVTVHYTAMLNGVETELESSIKLLTYKGISANS